MHQHEHIFFNASHYPGTRQLCTLCGEPTERCEEDSLTDADGNEICEDCFDSIDEEE